MSTRQLVACLIALAMASSASAAAPARRPKPGKKAVVGAKTVGTRADSPPSDLKTRTKYVNGAQVSENTAYFKGVRQRFEFPGLTLITQCDLKRTVQLNQATQRFLVMSTKAPMAPPEASAAEVPAADPQMADQMAALSAMGARGSTQPSAKGGVITETTTLTDTGERKQMFGREARHIKIVTVRQPDAKACDQEASRVETDGWYVDLPERAACPAVPTSSAPPAPAAQACTDRMETRQIGGAKLGFALSTLITTTTDEGKDVRTMATEVTDLQVASLDAALFDVPPGYTEVTSYQALVPALAAGGSLEDAVFGSLSEGTSTVAPKKPGVIRIGIADPTNKSGRTMSMAMLRGGLISSLTKVPFEAVPVAGALPADIDRDAVQKACDFILFTEIAELKTSKPGKVGGMLRRASGETNVPTEVHAARIQYKLYAVGNQSKPRFASAAKASSGGGFGIGSALKVAKFAGFLYLRMQVGMLGGGMLGPYSSLMGGGGGGGLASSLINPGLGAAMSMMSQAQGMGGVGVGVPGMGMPGMEDASSQRATQTVQQAFAKAGSDVADELKKGRP